MFVLLFGLVIGSTSAWAQSAQSKTWSVDYRHEGAAVTDSGIDSTWTSDRVQSLWSRSGQDGWLFTVDRQTRYGFVDTAISTGGYWRSGSWTFGVDAAATPSATFLYRVRSGGDVSYRAVGTFVASGGYHFFQFPTADVHQLTPALIWYHPRGEVEGRVYVTRNSTYDRTSAATLVRTNYDLTPRLRVGGGVSVGDRIFDVASLAQASAPSRVGFIDVRVGITAHDFIAVVGTFAHEDPAFTYQSFTLGYRRVF